MAADMAGGGSVVALRSGRTAAVPAAAAEPASGGQASDLRNVCQLHATLRLPRLRAGTTRTRGEHQPGREGGS